MSRMLVSRTAAGTLLSLLVLAFGAPTAAACPDHLDTATTSLVNQRACPLQRIDTQLIRCDNLTGAGVPAPLFIPELEPAR